MKKQDKNPILHPLGIGPLIELFYSLAIVSGLEFIFNLLFDPSSKKMGLLICASLGALSLSLGDWAVFHLFVSPHRYKRIIRVLIDLSIVVAIFVSFRTINNPLVFAIAMSLYFILGVIYHFLLINENIIDFTLNKIAFLQGALAILSISIIIAHLLYKNISDLLLIGSSLLGMLWGIANLNVANSFLKNDSTD